MKESTILVVDDEPANLQILLAFLQSNTLIGFVFLLFAITFTPIWAMNNRTMLDDDAKSCLKGTQLNIAYVDQDSWHITGVMEINDIENFVPDNRPQISGDYLGDAIRINDEDWKLNRRKLFIKLVFDLDSHTSFMEKLSTHQSLS